jgi:hypothetical protein
MTNLIRFAPSTDMRRLQREIDRMFEEFFPRSGGENADAEQAVWAPRVDLPAFPRTISPLIIRMVNWPSAGIARLTRL